MIARRITSALAGVVVTLGLSGCATTDPHREERMTHGYVYYLDGAGGGGAIVNYAGGVQKGLIDAGYGGAGEMFKWQTGLGVVADQTASEGYKRKKAEELADKVRAYRAEHPGAPVTLMGLSAGTAVAVFTLEALPVGTATENVILLAGSLSSSYDLTEALRRVKDKLYVFSSDKDAVLGFLVPMSGTADRAKGTTETIGLQGVRVPEDASAETLALYDKVVEIPWNERFSEYGHRGGHTDVVRSSFVRAFIAPLVVSRYKRGSFASEPEAGGVRNPKFERWARFRPGSWVAYEGYQIIDGVRRTVRGKRTLVYREDDHLIVDAEIDGIDPDEDVEPYNRRYFITRMVELEDDPGLHPSSTVKRGEEETVTVGDRRLSCRVETISAAGEFSEWGVDPEIEVCASPEIPGGFARMHLKARWDDRPVEIVMKATGFGIER